MALTVTPAELTATALTLTTAAQPNITSVGTLSGLTTAGVTMSNGGDRALTGPLNQSLLINARPNDATEGLFMQINGVNKLSVIQNGNVGIGTDNPGAQLQIYNAAAGALPLLRTMSHATAAGSFDGDYSVEFRHATSTVTHAMLVTNVEANDARRTLDVGDSNGVFASFVNGKVGIGVTSPDSKLHVKHAVVALMR